MYVACLAARLLAGLGLGALVRTARAPGGGNPSWWLVAQPIDPQSHALLDLLGIHTTSTPSLATLAERNAAPLVKLPRAPDITWSEVVMQSRDDVLSFLGLDLPGVAVPDVHGVAAAPVLPGVTAPVLAPYLDCESDEPACEENDAPAGCDDEGASSNNDALGAHSRQELFSDAPVTHAAADNFG